MTFVGFDLHKRYITACALDDTGGIRPCMTGRPTRDSCITVIAARSFDSIGRRNRVG